MLKYERNEEIVALLKEKGHMTVAELSSLLYTSESSIRRDLIQLEEKGLIERHYGGAELKRSSSIIPFTTRSHHNSIAKRNIAEKASQLIKKGDIIFLDQSSSALYVAQAISELKDITIVTNNVEILSVLSDSQLEVFSSGGLLSPDNRNCLMGEDAHHIFKNIRADIMFFSAKALSGDGKIYDCNRSEVCIREAMMKNAVKKVFLCDSDKIFKTSGYLQCSLEEIDIVISEKDMPDTIKNSFENVQFI